MRKGLVVTLGVVAFSLAISRSFAVAPVISCIPDIIVSDSEQNTATSDRNFFIFSNALDLDEYVRDDDTSKSALRWCFIETAPPPRNSITINGIGSYPGTAYTNPVGYDYRLNKRYATFRNVKWSTSVVPSAISFPNPGVASMQSMIQMIVSDGTRVDSQTVTVTSVNTNTNLASERKDQLQMQRVRQWTFATNSEGWTWYDAGTGGGIRPPSSHPAGGSFLQITELAALVPIVYGAWESPRDPAVALKARWGCILRARYRVIGSTNGQASPGFRLRAIWTPVLNAGASGWIVDFTNRDYGDNLEVTNYTYDLGIAYVPGREPGTGAGKTYTMLMYPQQFDSLMTSGRVVYITFDMVDSDSFGNDAGTLYVDQVDVDSVDRPDITSPLATAEAGFSFTNFTGWITARSSFAAGATSAGLTITPSATDIAIVIPSGSRYTEVSAVNPSPQPMISGRYYRTIYTVTSAQTGTNFGPLIRPGFTSTRFIWAVTKSLAGGGTYSQIGTTPSEFEVWAEAPSPYPQTGTITEAIQLRFSSYVSTNPDPVFGNMVAGTLRCTRIVTQSFAASSFPVATP